MAANPAPLMVGLRDSAIAYQYNEQTLLWESTCQTIAAFYHDELLVAANAMWRKCGGGDANARSQPQVDAFVAAMAEALPTRQVGDKYGRVAYQGGFFMYLDELNPRVRLATDRMYQEMHATYTPGAKGLARVASMLFGPRKNKTRAEAERNFVAAFAFANRAHLAGPGGDKLFAIMHSICGHTDVIRRYIRPVLGEERYWEHSALADFDPAKLDKDTLFTWICQQSEQYGY